MSFPQAEALPELHAGACLVPQQTVPRPCWSQHVSSQPGRPHALVADLPQHGPSVPPTPSHSRQTQMSGQGPTSPEQKGKGGSNRREGKGVGRGAMHLPLKYMTHQRIREGIRETDRQAQNWDEIPGAPGSWGAALVVVSRSQANPIRLGWAGLLSLDAVGLPFPLSQSSVGGETSQGSQPAHLTGAIPRPGRGHVSHLFGVTSGTLHPVLTLTRTSPLFALSHFRHITPYLSRAFVPTLCETQASATSLS